MSHEDLAFRSSNAIDQLQRYGDAVHSTELAAVLEKLTDINDGLCNGYDYSGIGKDIDACKALLDDLARVEGLNTPLEQRKLAVAK